MQNEIMLPRRTSGEIKTSFPFVGMTSCSHLGKKFPAQLFKGATSETSIEIYSFFLQGGQREGDARVEQEDAHGNFPRGGRHRS